MFKSTDGAEYDRPQSHMQYPEGFGIFDDFNSQARSIFFDVRMNKK